MASLQDQLLKAGLTTKQKARQANTEKRKTNIQKKSGANVEASLQEQVQQNLAKEKAEKIAKDNELNAQKKLALAEKEKTLRLLQILQHHVITRFEGDIEYNYTFNGKIKKLLVNKTTQKALINGRLAVCGLQEKTYLVTAETAEKIATIDKAVILLRNEKVDDGLSNNDDPYAEFQIPDDLMW